MTEIQEAFEKVIVNQRPKSYSLERWHHDWPQPMPGEFRYYSSINTEMDFKLFSAGWEAAKNG